MKLKLAAFVAVKKTRLWVLLLTAGILLVDQLTKLWAVNALDDGNIDLFWTLRFNLVKNSGTIFGLGGDFGLWLALVGSIISVFLLFVILSLARYQSFIGNHVSYMIGIALILGGAIGNLGDRIFRSEGAFAKGSVIDFIDVQWWPVFNIADSAITIGVFLIVWLNVTSIFKPPLEDI